MMNDFEWELSKENIQPLRGGRSVDVLNKVLLLQRTTSFQTKRQNLRQLFELNLAHLPNSRKKLRIYARYLEWVEQNYPCLGKSADIENLLYRCVRDCSGLENIHNDETYVKFWIRLTEFCDQPVELCELLFRQGIGSMCALFYLHWANRLEALKLYKKAAFVYLHGLRAGARPILSVEDQAENFVTQYNAYQTKLSERAHDDVLFKQLDGAQNSESCETNLFRRFSNNENEDTSNGTRQKLASLKLIDDDRRISENGTTIPLKVPVNRTKNMWHSSQSGCFAQKMSFKCCSNTSNQTTFQIKRDCAAPTNSDTQMLLHNLSPIKDINVNLPGVIYPVGAPGSWQKENKIPPAPWNKSQIDSSKLNHSRNSAPTSQRSWQIYNETEPESTLSDIFLEKINLDPTASSKNPSSIGKRKGLVLSKSASPHHENQNASYPLIPVNRLNRLIPASCTTKSGTSVRETRKDEFTNETFKHLNFPSLPADCSLFERARINCSLDLIYGGVEELCWEMHRGLIWEKVHTNDAPLQTKSALCSTDELEECEILEEIRLILNGEVDSGELRLDEFAGNTITQNMSSGRNSLIKKLESIAFSD